jgi:hypothetical protein
VKGLLAVICVALAFPAAAGAKEFRSLTLCGASGCATDSSPEDVGPLGVAFMDNLLSNRPTPSPQPYYRVVIDVGGSGTWTQWYLPGVHMLADRDESGTPVWWNAQRFTIFGKLARQVKPFATPTLAKVLVDGKPVADTSAYLALLGGLPVTMNPKDDGKWVQLSLTPSRPSPWLLETTGMLFRPDSSTVYVYEPVAVPGPLANLIRADAGLPILDIPGGNRTGPVAWGLLVGWIPIVIALGLFWTRRRARPDAAPA